MKRIYLIDCPGIVPPNQNDSEQYILMRGVVRVENVEYPAQYIDAVLNKTKPRHIEKTYDVRGWTNAMEVLEMLARKAGKLLKGGEPDLDGVAKTVLNDFMRGKIPWFTPPPDNKEETGNGVDGREGRLGEMGKKRKQEEDVSMDDDDQLDIDSEFEGFDDQDNDVQQTRDSSDESEDDASMDLAREEG